METQTQNFSHASMPIVWWQGAPVLCGSATAQSHTRKPGTQTPNPSKLAARPQQSAAPYAMPRPSTQQEQLRYQARCGGHVCMRAPSSFCAWLYMRIFMLVDVQLFGGRSACVFDTVSKPAPPADCAVLTAIIRAAARNMHKSRWRTCCLCQQLTLHTLTLKHATNRARKPHSTTHNSCSAAARAPQAG